MKKGFTLIEMIGVMVILSLLLLFAMPNVINYIKKGGDTKDKVVKTMIYEASKQYIEDNQNMFKKDSKNTYCISVNTLATEGYVESPITLSSSDEDITSDKSTKTVKVTYNKKYKYELVDECHGIVNPTPILYKGLTPVIYNEATGNWVVVDPKSDDWYNYDEQKWANAVVLGTGVKKQVGDTVAVDGTEAKMMLVWIPRYEYKIEGQYGKHSDGTTGTQDAPGEIKVNFVGKNTKTAKEGYHIHPAFTFGEKEESGFWVGKFEISHTTKSREAGIENYDSDLDKLNCITSTCSEAQYLRILPNVQSLRYNNISNFWYGIKSIEAESSFGLSNIDVHMMKNSEWGAVAYLSQSKYGKYGNSDYSGANKEVYQNKSSDFITGSSNGTPSQEGYRSGGQCAYNDLTNLGEGKGKCGPGASTTGNIYGVYDMSGGSFEHVMGVYENDNGIYSGYGRDELSNSGFAGRIGEVTFINGSAMPDSKYYDKYTNPTNSRDYDATESCDNGICYGHALSETKGWYKDGSEMIVLGTWFLRGDCSESDNYTPGVFEFYAVYGNIDYRYSARVVGIGK